MKDNYAAVWPGWGHASENPKCNIDIVMSLLGGPDDGPLQANLNAEGIFEKGTARNVEEAVEAAERIGYDNGIKASEGGRKGICFVDNGGIHKFADSQFGHLLAMGPNRDTAGKALVLSLKEMEVCGDIRNSGEYLVVKLSETDDFKANTIDSAWLDGILAEKSVTVDMPDHEVVFKGFEHVKSSTEDVLVSFRKGQTGTGDISGINSFSTEVAYMDTKYNFQVERISPDVYMVTLAGNVIDVEVTETAAGALLATFGGETHRILGMDEPLGLRLSLDGNTILM